MATKAQIVNQMLSDARTEKDHGWNAALIVLLKQDYACQSQPKPQPTDVRNVLIGIMGFANADSISSAELDMLITFKQDKAKLNAVKLVKDITGAGLKESKDWIDEWFNM